MKVFKRTLCLALMMVLLICIGVPVMAEEPVKVVVGGKRVRFDVQPQIINDRTMVPLRAIFEEIGAAVDWNAETRTVTSTKRGTKIKLTIDELMMYVNEKEVSLDSPACIVNGRTLVPVRAISEAFDLKVEWDESTRTARVKVPVSLEVESVDTKKMEYDDYGNLTYTEYNDGSWVKCVYDNDGTETHYGSDDSWSKYFRDEYGNEVYYENSSGWWRKFEYDERGNETYFENANGYWEKYTYDERGNKIYYEDSDGCWEKIEYDEYGNWTYSENSDGCWYKNSYDENGNLAYSESFNGFLEKTTYGENTKDVEYSGGSWAKYISYENGDEEMYTSYGFWEKRKRDATGNEIYREDSYGYWEKSTYDENGNLIYREDSDGGWEKHTYDENGNKIYYETANGYWAKYIIKEI